MRKSAIFIGISAVLSLSACIRTVDSVPTSPPASAAADISPIDNVMSIIDDDRIDSVVHGVDFAAATIDALIAAKKITPGTPQALAIADALDKVRDTVNSVRRLRSLGRLADAAREFQRGEGDLDNINLALTALLKR